MDVIMLETHQGYKLRETYELFYKYKLQFEDCVPSRSMSRVSLGTFTAFLLCTSDLRLETMCSVCWCVVAADLLATWSRLMFLSSSSLKPGTSTMKTCPPSVPNSSSSPEEWASTAVTLVTLGRALRCRRKDRCYHRNKINSPKPPTDLYTRTVYKHKLCFSR